MVTTIHIARRFLAIGGRFTLDPEGCIDLGVDMRRVFGLEVPPREQRRLLRRVRAAGALVARRGDELAALVLARGQPVRGWSVWRSC